MHETFNEILSKIYRTAATAAAGRHIWWAEIMVVARAVGIKLVWSGVNGQT